MPSWITSFQGSVLGSKAPRAHNALMLGGRVNLSPTDINYSPLLYIPPNSIAATRWVPPPQIACSDLRTFVPSGKVKCGVYVLPIVVNKL